MLYLTDTKLSLLLSLKSKMAEQSKNVVIYSTPTCHFCQMAKNFFEEHGIEYTDYNVAEDIEKAREMVEKTGQMGVPVIDIDGEIVIGFDEPRLRELLGL